MSKIIHNFLSVLLFDTDKDDNQMSRNTKWARHVARMRVKRNAYRLLVGMPKGKNIGAWIVL
jgi:hypothetical protein